MLELKSRQLILQYLENQKWELMLKPEKGNALKTKKDNSKVQTGKQVSLANSHEDTHTIRHAGSSVNISN
jgi:hypothetical protein